MNHYNTLEFNTILDQLADCAVSYNAKVQCKAMTPATTLPDAIRKLNETGDAKKIMEHIGTPPLAIMTDLDKIITLLQADALLTTEQISHVVTFLATCQRMKSFLKRAEATATEIAYYGNAMMDLTELENEINRCVHNGQIDDRATPHLHDTRRAIERKGEQIKTKIESLLKANKQYCVDGFALVKNGRYTMPVHKNHKNKIPGIVVEISNTGGTCYIEPTAVTKLTDELGLLRIEEDNEVRMILYTLTAAIYDQLPSIKQNKEAMETLDFVFAKAKLSITMNAGPIHLTETREIRLLDARHPLLGQNHDPVPLNFALGSKTQGIVITGPNTGGKTVAIKTVGLMALMAQSGLHIPADARSSLCLFDAVWCDIGDGQSISQNLSTFSSHMTNIIDVLSRATNHSLILFDELGSGTDPAEGMGIATAILEELLQKNCLFTVTTHYPEIKDFAKHTSGILNARMAFDRETLMPLYKLEIGEAGESCALYIAERLGMPPHILTRARDITYSSMTLNADKIQNTHDDAAENIITVTAREIEAETTAEKPIPRSQTFQLGDSVTVYPQKVVGIIYQCANEMGEIGVQVQGKKMMLNHKRIKLKVAAAELYPDDYDFSIIFDSVDVRKARHDMSRKHVAGKTLITE